ncbi:bifunctional lysine-specific demethylase and histidyl-hydroxylase NO66 [Toxorhynchites rutilus septentrionalis]|uniref:bifunctional lysine-specific demethylase and histidyl-hydroxylase NO66 n=1 Tax=Toxorhynchites rutilus septentrionalis TaxID=329112 RepID=UPI00247A1042|nr:bifunctional lysine-specific demethylase and histidyl-hydroxylase NO66 [Toxorhynchites rutilus septentrionalis]
MSGVMSIFDTPRAPTEHLQVDNNQTKKKKPLSNKKKMIDQLLQEQLKEFSKEEQNLLEEPSMKKRKKGAQKDTSASENKKITKNGKNASLNGSKKKQNVGLKIVLKNTMKHKQKLRKSLDAVNHSKRGREETFSDELLEASFNGSTLKDGSNHSTPVLKKTKSKEKKGTKNKSRIIPLPMDFTPSKIVVKKEPITPKNVERPVKEQLGDSLDVGREKLAWVIHPITVEDFMNNYWEKKPLLIQRNNSTYYKNLLSRGKIDEMLRRHNIEYTKNIDVTSYKEGKRETHNPDGRVLPPDMWQFYEEGCSIRMLNPQTYLNGVYEMNVKLQEFFHCMTGANFYLTPPNSQGFAPHYDDIEAFVLQVEGRKHWKLYSPRDASEVLARVSSPNFNQEEIGLPILEVTLEPGDLLYFPRGIIHQACTVSGHHSLHVTMSVYQKNSWADLMEIFLPHALAQAAESYLELRQGIPRDLHDHFGIVHSDNETTARADLVRKVKSLVDKVFSVDAIDFAVDQLGKRFQHDALPPQIADSELPGTVYGANFAHNADGTVTLRTPFTLNTTVRLLRRNILRLVNEDSKLHVYYHTDNSREYHEFEPNFLEVDNDAALGVELLIKMYPKPVPIADLPLEDKVEFAKSLWEKGLILVNGK